MPKRKFTEMENDEESQIRIRVDVRKALIQFGHIGDNWSSILARMIWVIEDHNLQEEVRLYGAKTDQAPGEAVQKALKSAKYNIEGKSDA